MNTDETKEQQKRITMITATIAALVVEHGPMLVAGAIQAFALSSTEYMTAALRVSLLARDMVMQKRAEEAETCQCAECRAQRGQA